MILEQAAVCENCYRLFPKSRLIPAIEATLEDEDMVVTDMWLICDECDIEEFAIKKFSEGKEDKPE